MGDISGKEIAGATCVVEARDYSATVVTPAKLRVPIYRGSSSPLFVNCKLEGYQPKSAEIRVYNETKSARNRSAASGGVIGVVAIAAINAMSDDTTHDFRYGPVRVALRPLVKDKKKKRQQ